MKLCAKRRYWLVACSLVVAAVAAWVEPTGVIRGWLRGEAFYDGRPTNYWSRELARWEHNVWFIGLYYGSAATYYRMSTVADPLNTEIGADEDVIPPEPEPDQKANEGEDPHLGSSQRWYSTLPSYADLPGSYRRSPGIVDRVAGWFGVTLGSEEPPGLLNGDSEAEAVLRELLADPNETVRAHAQRGLDEIARGKAP
jgi:hypothetical protein